MRQYIQAPPLDGRIQRLCDECGAEKEKEEEKQPEIIQTKAEISEAKDYTQNTFSSIKGDEETEIWQPKIIDRIDTKIVARNELTQPSITKGKPSRIRAKKLDELFGKKETLPAGEIASPQSEVVETTETEELHPPIQAKLTVGEAGDKYEQEADAVAAQVVDKINSPTPQESVQPQLESGATSVPNITVMRHSESGTSGGTDVTDNIQMKLPEAQQKRTETERIPSPSSNQDQLIALLPLAIPVAIITAEGVKWITVTLIVTAGALTIKWWNDYGEEVVRELGAAKDWTVEKIKEFVQSVFHSENESEIDPDDPDRDGSKDRKLSDEEIERLQDAGIDIHEIKKDCPGGIAKCDLFKDRAGNIYVKPKRSRGPGDFTGYNINDF